MQINRNYIHLLYMEYKHEKIMIKKYINLLLLNDYEIYLFIHIILIF